MGLIERLIEGGWEVGGAEMCMGMVGGEGDIEQFPCYGLEVVMERGKAYLRPSVS